MEEKRPLWLEYLGWGEGIGRQENEVRELRRSWRGKVIWGFIEGIRAVTFTLNELGSYHSSEVT